MEFFRVKGQGHTPSDSMLSQAYTILDHDIDYQNMQNSQTPTKTLLLSSGITWYLHLQVSSLYLTKHIQTEIMIFIFSYYPSPNGMAERRPNTLKYFDTFTQFIIKFY